MNKKVPKWVMVSGGFDPIHVGHVRMFREADIVLTQLRQAQAQPAPASDPAAAAPTALIRHLIDTHHAFTRNELARLETLLDKVIGRPRVSD